MAVGFYKTTWSGAIDNQYVVNVLYFQATVSAGSTVQTTQNLLDGLIATIVPSYLPVLPT